jgi:hypothetical protein
MGRVKVGQRQKVGPRRDGGFVSKAGHEVTFGASACHVSAIPLANGKKGGAGLTRLDWPFLGHSAVGRNPLVPELNMATI